MVQMKKQPIFFFFFFGYKALALFFPLFCCFNATVENTKPRLQSYLYWLQSFPLRGAIKAKKMWGAQTAQTGKLSWKCQGDIPITAGTKSGPRWNPCEHLAGNCLIKPLFIMSMPHSPCCARGLCMYLLSMNSSARKPCNPQHRFNLNYFSFLLFKPLVKSIKKAVWTALPHWKIDIFQFS